ncbi:MAG TPA: TolC family protein [Gemmatimonadaceae bacterium]|nr:TolC family protein [Gemmatimonadaceae bacterium]
MPATQRLLTLVVGATMLSATPLRAQAARSLSLADAIAAAERGNPDYQITRSDETVAVAALRESWGAYLPSVGASVGFGGSSSRRLTTFDEFGNAVRLDDALTSRTSSALQSVGAELLLFDGFRREQMRNAARSDVRAVDARIAARRVRLRAEVARQYYRALGAERRVRLEEGVLASAREQLATTERRFLVASARREDVLGAREAILSAQAQVAQARGDAAKDRLLLAELLGGESDAPLELTDSLPVLGDTLAASADELVALALRASPVLQERDAALQTADRRLSASRGAWWPSVRASARYGRSLSDRLNGALFDFNPPDQAFSLSLDVTLPVLDQFRRPADVARAAEQRDDQAQSLRAARLRMEQEVRAALIDTRNAEQRVRLAEQASALSRERVELAEQRYRAGGLALPELQQILDRAAASERTEVAARVDFATARATLQERVGGELPR